jgi:phage baseplate assembly protein W
MARYNDLRIKPNPNTKGNQERRTQVYRGVSTVNPDNRSFSTYDINLIRQDIINHFHIRKGEKIYNADFGTIIWNILFEPFTNVVKEAVASDVADILNSEPRITVDSLNIVEKDYGLQVLASVTYKTYNISETLQLNFDRDNGLISN